MAKKLWWGEKLAQLEALYRNAEIPLREVSQMSGASLGTIARLSRLNNWPGRRTFKRVALTSRVDALETRVQALEVRLGWKG